MLLSPIVHPPLLRALSQLGRSDSICLVDSGTGLRAIRDEFPSAELIHLNLGPGVLSAAEVASGLCQTVSVAKAWIERGHGTEIEKVFSAACVQISPVLPPSVAVVIVTGDTSPCRILLEVGPLADGEVKAG